MNRIIELRSGILLEEVPNGSNGAYFIPDSLYQLVINSRGKINRIQNEVLGIASDLLTIMTGANPNFTIVEYAGNGSGRGNMTIRLLKNSKILKEGTYQLIKITKESLPIAALELRAGGFPIGYNS